MCEGVGEDSKYGAWHVGIRVGMCILILECVYVCHCMCTYVGSSPCRRIHLLGIADPVVGKYFQVLEVHWGMKHTQELSCEKGLNLDLLCFVKLWVENPIFVYVNEKFCNKNLF